MPNYNTAIHSNSVATSLTILFAIIRSERFSAYEVNSSSNCAFKRMHANSIEQRPYSGGDSRTLTGNSVRINPLQYALF
jgi:hypothetical protein